MISEEEKKERTVLASVIVSTKVGIPLEANSNKALGLKMTEVFFNKLNKASISTLTRSVLNERNGINRKGKETNQ